MRRLPLLLLPLFLLAGPAPAAPLDAVWTDPSLETREVAVLSLGNGRLRFVDADRNVGEASLRGVVRLAFAADPAEAAAPTGGLLRLTDGQRLAGSVAEGPAASAEHLRWRHPWLGERDVPLERVAAVELTPGPDDAAGPPGRAAPTADEVRLANGDALVGFVSAAGPGGVTIEPEGPGGPGGEPATLPWSAVAAVRLANPPAAPPAGDLLRLRDGSRVAVAGLRHDGSMWTVETAGGGAAEAPAHAVAACEPGASGLRLLDAADLAVVEPEPADVFGVPFPASWGGGTLHLHAPTAVRVAAPGGGPATARLVRLRVALEPAAAASPLASVDVTLGAGEPVRLDAGRPAAELRAEAVSLPLELTLGEAEHGPVLDRVVVERLEVLIEATGD